MIIRAARSDAAVVPGANRYCFVKIRVNSWIKKTPIG